MATTLVTAAIDDSDDDLRKLCESICSINPFEVNRVTGSQSLEFDVPSIHGKAFKQLTEMAQRALDRGIGIGATLLGASGVGKSHLLARLSRWAMENHACYVYLHNIQAAPEEMGRYLAKCCVAQLAEDRLERLDETLLFRIVKTAISQAAKQENLTSLNAQNRAQVFKRLAGRLGGDADIFHVIFTFFENVRRAAGAKSDKLRGEFSDKAALAVRWLKGDWVDIDELKTLGIRYGGDKEHVRLPDQNVLAAILMIARLARESGLPFILCLDQIDTMRADRLGALFVELHHLLDGQSIDGRREVTNLLVVVSGVEEDLRRLYNEHVFPRPSAARLKFDQPISLLPVTPDEIRALLSERLHKFVDHYPRPAPYKAFFQDDDLFPLGKPWFVHSFAGPRTSPRDAISWASQRWQEIETRIVREEPKTWLGSWKDFAGQPPVVVVTSEQRAALIDEKVRLKWAEAVNARRLQPGTLPADAGNMLNLTAMLLEQCLNRDIGYSLDRFEVFGVDDPINLVVHENNGKPLRNHAQFIVTSSKTSAAARLRRLLEPPKKTHVDFRLLITDQDRSPLQLGTAGRQHLDGLNALGKEGFVHIPLTFDQYAQLDAMAAVINNAKAGDLEIEPNPGHFARVEPAEVIETYHRLDMYRSHALLQYFLTEPTEVVEPDPEPMPNGELRDFIVSKLSLEMGANLSQLLQSFCASRNCTRESKACLAWAKELVVAMNDERIISAKPWNDDFYLTSL